MLEQLRNALMASLDGNLTVYEDTTLVVNADPILRAVLDALRSVDRDTCAAAHRETPYPTEGGHDDAVAAVQLSVRGVVDVLLRDL